MRNVKIRVENEAQSEFVQKQLIASGARWASGDKLPILRDGYFDATIEVNSRGIMYVVPNHEANTFVEVRNVFVLVDNRPKIVFQGKTYLVADVEEALDDAGVEPL